MQLFVKQLSGSIITVHAGPLDLIRNLKANIPEVIASPNLQLSLGGRFLDNDRTLIDCGVHEECTLGVAVRLCGGMMPQQCPMPALLDSAEAQPEAPKKESLKAFNLLYPGQIQLSIRTIDGRSLAVHLSPASKVLVLKQSIEEELKVPVQEQRLLFSGKLLEDKRTLAHYELQHDNAIQLSTRRVPPSVKQAPQTRKEVSDKEVQIFVKHLNGKSMAIMVSPADTVESLLEKVEERTGIPMSQQRIIYGGKQLVPERILADYNVQKESTLHLVLRLRGGD